MATRSWWIVDRDHRRDHQAPRPALCVERACLFCYDRLFDQVDGGARAYARRLDQLAADGLPEDEAESSGVIATEAVRGADRAAGA